ncbi:MAG: hypothetical protein JSS53_01835 [Proteobacteria bacterium]|nr:hypothetical protein [Pseudomonadota bacterium]
MSNEIQAIVGKVSALLSTIYDDSIRVDTPSPTESDEAKRTRVTETLLISQLPTTENTPITDSKTITTMMGLLNNSKVMNVVKNQNLILRYHLEIIRFELTKNQDSINIQDYINLAKYVSLLLTRAVKYPETINNTLIVSLELANFLFQKNSENINEPKQKSVFDNVLNYLKDHPNDVLSITLTQAIFATLRFFFNKFDDQVSKNKSSEFYQDAIHLEEYLENKFQKHNVTDSASNVNSTFTNITILDPLISKLKTQISVAILSNINLIPNKNSSSTTNDDALDISIINLISKIHPKCHIGEKLEIADILIELNDFLEARIQNIMKLIFENPLEKNYALKETLSEMTNHQYKSIIAICEVLDASIIQLNQNISAVPLSSNLPLEWKNFKSHRVFQLLKTIAENSERTPSTEFPLELRQKIHDESIGYLTTFLLNCFFKPEERFPIDDYFIERFFNRLHYEIEKLIISKKPISVNGFQAHDIKEILNALVSGLDRLFKASDHLLKNNIPFVLHIKISAGVYIIKDLKDLSRNLDNTEKFVMRKVAITQCIFTDTSTLTAFLLSGELNQRLEKLAVFTENTELNFNDAYPLLGQFINFHTEIVNRISTGYIQKWLEFFTSDQENSLCTPINGFRNSLMRYLGLFHEKIFQAPIEIEKSESYLELAESIDLFTSDSLDFKKTIRLNLYSFLCKKLLSLLEILNNKPSKDPLTFYLEKMKTYASSLEIILNGTTEILLLSTRKKLESYLSSIEKSLSKQLFVENYLDKFKAITGYLNALLEGLSIFSLVNPSHVIENKAVWIESLLKIQKPLEICIELSKENENNISGIILLLHKMYNAAYCLDISIQDAQFKETFFLREALSRNFLELTNDEQSKANQPETLLRYYGRLKKIATGYLSHAKENQILDIELALFQHEISQADFKKYLISFLKKEPWLLNVPSDVNFFSWLQQTITKKISAYQIPTRKKLLEASEKPKIQAMKENYQQLHLIIKELATLLASLKEISKALAAKTVNNQQTEATAKRQRNLYEIYESENNNYGNIEALLKIISDFLTILKSIRFKNTPFEFFPSQVSNTSVPEIQPNTFDKHAEIAPLSSENTDIPAPPNTPSIPETAKATTPEPTADSLTPLFPPAPKDNLESNTPSKSELITSEPITNSATPIQPAAPQNNSESNQPVLPSPINHKAGDLKIFTLSIQTFIDNRTMNTMRPYNSDAEQLVFALALRDWSNIANLSIRMGFSPSFINAAQEMEKSLPSSEESMLLSIVQHNLSQHQWYQSQFFITRDIIFPNSTLQLAYCDSLAHNQYVQYAEECYRIFLFGIPGVSLGIIPLAAQTWEKIQFLVNHIQSSSLNNTHQSIDSNSSILGMAPMA